MNRLSQSLYLCGTVVTLLSAPAWAAFSCTWSSAPGVSFGVYDEFGTPTDTTATIVTTCSNTGLPSAATVMTVTIGPSANSGSTAVRLMAGGSPNYFLQYNLYSGAARSKIWGNSVGVNSVNILISGIPTNGTKDYSFTIYGRIPANLAPRVGNYTDTVSLTVSP